MPWVGFEPTVPASERAKTVHALDRSSTVTGVRGYRPTKLLENKNIYVRMESRIYLVNGIIED
jgi:hypothetical protein